MIPKVIHQVWIGPRPVPEEYIDTWRELADRTGWKHHLWREEHAEEIVTISKPVFEEWNHLHGRANLYRLEILYKYGGVYFDADYLSLGRPLDEVIPLQADLVGTTEHHFPRMDRFENPFNPLGPNEVPMSILLQCGFYAARPGHPQINHWLETAVEAYQRGRGTGHPAFGSVTVCGAYHISRHLQYPITILPFQWLIGRENAFADYRNRYPDQVAKDQASNSP